MATLLLAAITEVNIVVKFLISMKFHVFNAFVIDCSGLLSYTSINDEYFPKLLIRCA